MSAHLKVVLTFIIKQTTFGTKFLFLMVEAQNSNDSFINVEDFPFYKDKNDF